MDKYYRKRLVPLLLPAMILFIMVILIPFGIGVIYSFCGWRGTYFAGGDHFYDAFVGFQNYIKVFKSSKFRDSFVYTLEFTVVAVIALNIVSLIMALLATSVHKGAGAYRTIYFMPNLLGGLALGYIWQFVFNKVIVYFGDALNVTVLQKSMLSGSASAFAALVLVTIWQFSGYMMLIYIAGLTGVSEDLKEAAKIDGCNESQTTRYIVLPLMRASFTICMFLTITRCFMIYDVNLSLTEGGPYGSTVMAAMYVYQKAFSAKQYGVGQTEAIILFIFTAVIAVSQTIINKRKEVEA